jgi:hypothetical protein
MLEPVLVVGHIDNVKLVPLLKRLGILGYDKGGGEGDELAGSPTGNDVAEETILRNRGGVRYLRR